MAKQNPHHSHLLQEVRRKTGPPVTDEFLNHYLGAERRRYKLNNAAMRAIVGKWMKENKEGLSAVEIARVIGSLAAGDTVTEKMMGGFILDRCSAKQREFNVQNFDRWLNHLQGWAEVDTYCAGKYSGKDIPLRFIHWKPLLQSLAVSKSISKRRASLVLLCAPLRHSNDPRLSKLALANVRKVWGDKSVMITKAISWVLRSMVKKHRNALLRFLNDYRDQLPSIALRETKTKLATGRKTRQKTK